MSNAGSSLVSFCELLESGGTVQSKGTTQARKLLRLDGPALQMDVNGLVSRSEQAGYGPSPRQLGENESRCSQAYAGCGTEGGGTPAMRYHCHMKVQLLKSTSV